MTSLKAKTMVAIRGTTIQEPWVGISVLRGPTPVSIMWFNSGLKIWDLFHDPHILTTGIVDAEIPSDRLILYTLSFMYVKPQERNRGVGMKLIRAVIEAAKKDWTMQHACHALVICFINSTNIAAGNFLRKCGFKHAESRFGFDLDGQPSSVWTWTMTLQDVLFDGNN